jgi:hypothetical protein
MTLMSKSSRVKIANLVVNNVGTWDVQARSLIEEANRRQKVLEMMLDTFRPNYYYHFTIYNPYDCQIHHSILHKHGCSCSKVYGTEVDSRTQSRKCLEIGQSISLRRS